MDSTFGQRFDVFAAVPSPMPVAQDFGSSKKSISAGTAGPHGLNFVQFILGKPGFEPFFSGDFSSPPE